MHKVIKPIKDHTCFKFAVPFQLMGELFHERHKINVSSFDCFKFYLLFVTAIWIETFYYINYTILHLNKATRAFTVSVQLHTNLGSI